MLSIRIGITKAISLVIQLTDENEVLISLKDLSDSPDLDRPSTTYRNVIGIIYDIYSPEVRLQLVYDNYYGHMSGSIYGLFPVGR